MSAKLDRGMSWSLIETGQVNGLPLELYRSGGDFLIRVDGLELMNSRWHRSERAMAHLAVARTFTASPRILIGGLGLGFTLDAMVQAFAPSATLIVAEKSADVMRWHQEHFQTAFGFKAAPGTQILNEDVYDTICNQPPFDLIVLDVDNGPQPVSGISNQRLYQSHGLKLIRTQLNKNGTLLVWSGFKADSFQALVETVGFSVEVKSIDVGHRDHQHFVYVCKKD